MKSEKGLMHLLILVEVVVLILIVLAGIAKQVTEPQEEIRIPTDVTQNQIIEEPVIEPETPTETQTEETEEIEPVVFSAEVEAMLSAMSLEEKIAQLFLVTPEVLTGNDRVTIAGNGTRNALTEYPVGGIIYSRNNFMGQTQLRELLTGAQSISKEVTGRALFEGTLVENAGESLLLCAADGQENVLVSLFVANMSVTDEILMNLEEIRYIQSLENYVTLEEKLDCYNVINGGQSAVDALNAGVDMLYVTEGFENVYSVVLEAANTGQISEETIRLAVGRVLTGKQELSTQVVEE